MKKIVVSRLTINTRLKPVNTFNAQLEKKIVASSAKDTHIQVPGTVEAAAATNSDRRITARPLLRIVIFPPVKTLVELAISL